MLAFIALEKKNYDLIHDYANKVLTINPDCIYAKYLLASYYSLLNKIEKLREMTFDINCK
jgi:hypothetical protein